MQICGSWCRVCLHYAKDSSTLCHSPCFVLWNGRSFFSVVTGGKCGSTQGYTECAALNNCDGDISSHLAHHHLTRKNTCEKDLILARAGLLELTEEQITNMMVCPAHLFTLGKYHRFFLSMLSWILARLRGLPVSKTLARGGGGEGGGGGGG